MKTPIRAKKMEVMMGVRCLPEDLIQIKQYARSKALSMSDLVRQLLIQEGAIKL